MIDENIVAEWMLDKIRLEDCIYQEDVVDFLVKENRDDLLIENSDGNLVLGKKVLAAFRKITEHTVVWVRPGKYWRFRVKEDELGREARG